MRGGSFDFNRADSRLHLVTLVTLSPFHTLLAKNPASGLVGLGEFAKLPISAFSRNVRGWCSHESQGERETDL
jgi:hypothetical protein